MGILITNLTKREGAQFNIQLRIITTFEETIAMSHMDQLIQYTPLDSTVM